MASGSTVGDEGAKEKQRFTEHKVYTRKSFKGLKNKDNTVSAIASPPSTVAPTTVTTTVTTINNNDNENSTVVENHNDEAKDNGNNVSVRVPVDPTVNNNDNDNSTVDNRNDGFKDNENNDSVRVPVDTAVNNNDNSTVENRNDGAKDNENNDSDRVPVDTAVNNNDNSSVENLNDGAKNNEDNDSVRVPLPENGNLVPPDDENSARPEDGNSARPEDGNSAPPDDGNLRLDVVSDDSCSLKHHHDEPSSSLNVDAQPSSGNCAEKTGMEDRVKISLASRSKKEKGELRRRLESELEKVRTLVNRIEEKQGLVGGHGNSNVLVDHRHRVDNGVGAKRAHSEVASAGVVPREPTRPLLRQLSVSVLENSGISENVEKEKRTPKANQFYRNSEFLLGKDKLPPAESNKKSKLNGKKHGGGEMGHGLGMGSKYFKSCSSLLEKLMKHKHGWVFNAPVDVEALGLHDYFTIITHPMDLGTVKSKLEKNWYKSPKEFAEDVRLTFGNAMTYNPKGQDVHVMAEQLSRLFEDRWAIIESNYHREMRYGVDYGAAIPAPSPLSRKAPAFRPPPLDMKRILDRSESMTQTPKLMNFTPSSRTPAPKKPKAKDPHKRDMTYEEKQKLSTNLQSLPSEKLDAIVQIIKKRNSALSQHNDEIEVDIDSVDAETLWELDRFVTNYKKSLSKNKRKAELAMQARARAEQAAHQKSQTPIMIDIRRETQADERNVSLSLPVQGEIRVDNGSKTSSSSSSSSDSGSSSSDSDSDSSSASGSDAGSQRT